MRIFPRNHSVTVKLTFELIFIKFKYFFDVLANPWPICFTQMIHQCVNHKERLSLRYPLTNFSNFSATISKSTNTITVIQNTSKSYSSNNSKSGFTDGGTPSVSVLEVTDYFNVNLGDEAAIPSETIGTYQILNKVITDLSSLKKSIITRNKTLQKDVSNDADDMGDVNLTCKYKIQRQ